ncbi:hypothetical protein KA344_21135 [bacterium]|nr:hypothetical protein [bacterium]
MSGNIDRRGFIRSLFGITGALPVAQQMAEAKGQTSFFWCNLRTGHVGFPTGLSVPSERPGSLMKLVAAAALIDEGLTHANEVFECTGTHNVGKEAVHCQNAHGKIDIVQAIGRSCNIYFAQATKRLTTRAFLAKAAQFGLDKPCAGSLSGPFPLKPVESSSLHYVLGLAQDLKPTALQLLRLAALVATPPGGKLPVLFSAENIELPEKEKPFTSPLTAESHRVLSAGMRLSATEGTARKLDSEDQLKIAAKTGTTPHGNKFQSYVIGYFPFDKPAHAFALYAPSGTSQDSAVPKAKEFLFSTTWP